MPLWGVLIYIKFICSLLAGETVGEIKAVADMHQRQGEMAKHSLPG